MVRGSTGSPWARHALTMNGLAGLRSTIKRPYELPGSDLDQGRLILRSEGRQWTAGFRPRIRSRRAFSGVTACRAKIQLIRDAHERGGPDDCRFGKTTRPPVLSLRRDGHLESAAGEAVDTSSGFRPTLQSSREALRGGDCRVFTQTGIHRTHGFRGWPPIVPMLYKPPQMPMPFGMRQRVTHRCRIPAKAGDDGPSSVGA